MTAAKGRGQGALGFAPVKTGGIALLCLFAVLGADFVYTALFVDHREGFEARYRIRDRQFHHTFKKNYDDVTSWAGKPYSIRTNSLGFKDSTRRDVSKSAPRRRLLFIGDAAVEGLGLTWKDTFVGKIAIDSPEYEVLNAGEFSYSPVLYHRKVKWLLDSGYQFAEVWVFIDMSDIQDEATHYFCSDTDSRYRPFCKLSIEQHGSMKRAWTHGIKRFFADNFVLTYGALEPLWRNTTYDRLSPEWEELAMYAKDDPIVRGRVSWTTAQIEKDYWPLGAKKGLDRAVANMGQLHALLVAHDIGLTVVVYPWPTQLDIDEQDSRQRKIWGEWCAGRCDRFIDLFPVFFSYRDQHDDWYKDLYFDGDVNLNANGQQFVFENLRVLMSD